MLKDVNQNFFQLAAIQGASLGLPGMIVGEQIAVQFGTGTAITSICIGNLILWIIGLSMFSMTYKGQGNANHAIENVLTYFGKPTAFAASFILMIAFISWFSVQISTQADFTGEILANFSGWNATSSMIITILFALLIIGVSTFGIRTIKWVCTAALPILSLYIIYALIKQSGTVPPIEWNVSFYGVILIVVIIFPGIINLPTFFRHARSRPDGILGLALMILFIIIFQTASIWIQFNSKSSSLFTPYSPEAGWTFGLFMILGFTALSTFCINLVNIYFASAALELVVPNFTDARGYALIGLVGALAFGIFKGEALLNNLETITNNFIGCLGGILLAAYLVRTIITHRHRHFEKQINLICWFLGCAVSFTLFYINRQIGQPFVGGIVTSLFTFICIIFVEETIWSIRQIFTRQKNG